MDDLNLKCLAWVYLRLYDIVDELPGDMLGGLPELPTWFDIEPDENGDAIWQMINVAENSAKRILSEQ